MVEEADDRGDIRELPQVGGLVEPALLSLGAAEVARGEELERDHSISCWRSRGLNTMLMPPFAELVDEGVATGEGLTEGG